MKKVILMGKGELAVRVADWFLNSLEYELIAIVPVIPEPSWTTSLLKWSQERSVKIIKSGHYIDIEGVQEEEWKIDLVFSVFYDKIIKGWFINKCSQILNLHNGPLPRYRGVSPINWALKNNERLHGVTIHEITEGIDDGPIISQLNYSVYPEFDEVIDVLNRSVEYGWVLFQQTMPILSQIESIPQDHSKALYFNSRQNDLLGERRNFTKNQSIKS